MRFAATKIPPSSMPRRSVGIVGLILVMVFSAAANPPAWIEGEVLVRYRETPAGRIARHAIPESGTQRRSLRAMSTLKGRRIEVVRAPERGTLEILQEYARRPDVELVTPNYVRHIQRSTIPDADRFHQQWGLLNTGQTVNGFSGTPGADIAATRAWPMSRPSEPDRVIAVIDTGVDYMHPDLAEIMWINPGEQAGTGQDNDGNGYVDDVYGYDFSGASAPAYEYSHPPGPDPMDMDGHGTHVAGIAAATAHGGVAGVAAARIMALKASPDGGSIPLADSLEAMAYAIMMKRDYGVPVIAINASFGGTGGSNDLERQTIIEAGEAGIVVCAAAGNAGTDNDSQPFYPASYDLPNLIAVAGSTAQDERWASSNYGQHTVHLAAPGHQIMSSLPLWLNTLATLVQAGEPAYAATGFEFSGFTGPLTAQVFDCGIGASNQFPTAVEGNIALIERGELMFYEKVRNAMNAGAAAVIIYNNQAGTFLGTLVAPSDWIPALAISGTDGATILAALQTGPTDLTLSHEPDEDRAYGWMNGTSMAAPFVAGAITFMAYQFPDDTPAERIARLMETVDTLPDFELTTISGGRLNLQRAVDRDQDGLPDWWEIHWVGDLDTMDDTTDTAGNGFPDWMEYRAGTDPNDPNDALQLTAVEVLESGAHRLRWASVTNRFYRIGRTTEIQGTYTPVALEVPATPPHNTWTDHDVPATKPVFYRIELDD